MQSSKDVEIALIDRLALSDGQLCSPITFWAKFKETFLLLEQSFTTPIDDFGILVELFRGTPSVPRSLGFSIFIALKDVDDEYEGMEVVRAEFYGEDLPKKSWIFQDWISTSAENDALRILRELESKTEFQEYMSVPACNLYILSEEV